RDDSAASRKYHNRVARQYDQIYDDRYWEFHDELTWRSIKPHLLKSTTSACLDLGCGTGKWGLKLLKSGFPTTFVDHSPNMIDQARAKAEVLGPRAKHATFLVADIIDLHELPSNHFGLALAMGDPLSICSDPPAAVAEIFRTLQPGGIIIATADNKLAALDHFLERGDIDALEDFLRTSRTNWLTEDSREQFQLTMFTPHTLRRLFEKSSFHVLDLIGKTILPVRKHRQLLENPKNLRQLLDLEHDLQKDPASAARASHLQITARKP
ncbi:MAG TPA: class I SAM-dependent methyltransferase, partial [Tepidisphaeraceae bacterium]|nr:class I SAM-dependent methyltransferase [Tepidisphaeraceae bacterium]